VIANASAAKVDDNDSNKQIVPTFNAEVDEAVKTKRISRRTKSEICRPAMEYERTESEKVVEDDESEKQIVPAYFPEDDEEVVVDEANREMVTTPGIYRRTKSETKKEIIRPVIEIRRTESAKEVPIDRLSSEEFRLVVESFLKTQKKRARDSENDTVRCHVLGSRPGLIGGYGSC